MNKGFTLIELLAVIVILALIVLLAIPKLSDSTKVESDKVGKLTESIIYDAAKFYIDSNSDEYRNINSSIYCISLKTLADRDYLKNITDNSIIDTKTVKVTVKSDYTYELVDNSMCVENIPALEPDLHNNTLTPVKYENNEWKVADKEDIWYDYTKQEWANAVILKGGINKNIGNSVNIETEIEGMFVWIPRYEYKINNETKEIEIKYILRSKTKASEGYIIHPAFKIGEENISGIWVGKFETTGTVTNPKVIPNQESIKNQNVSSQYETAKKMNTYIVEGNSHMLKNSEWAAVAYLSQSKYGKYGNSNYGISEKEVEKNNCITKTGTRECSETYETNNGQKTSTTGNITGIYDMNGGTLETVMGIYNSNIGNSGFIELPEEYDNYESVNAIGHALSEVTAWNSPNTFITASNPYIVRGENGIFSYNNSDGNNLTTTFRIAIS